MHYPSGVSVDEGNQLTPTLVKDEPKVAYDANPNDYYTLAMTGKKNKKTTSYIAWQPQAFPHLTTSFYGPKSFFF